MLHRFYGTISACAICARRILRQNRTNGGPNDELNSNMLCVCVEIWWAYWKKQKKKFVFLHTQLASLVHSTAPPAAICAVVTFSDGLNIFSLLFHSFLTTIITYILELVAVLAILVAVFTFADVDAVVVVIWSWLPLYANYFILLFFLYFILYSSCFLIKIITYIRIISCIGDSFHVCWCWCVRT